MDRRELRGLEEKPATMRPAERCAVHALAQHFDGELQAGNHVDLVFVVLLEDALRSLVVRADCSSLPPAVVARGVGLVAVHAMFNA